MAAPHAHVVYNPTPPVKPVAKKSVGCVSVIGLLVVATAAAGALAGSLLH